MACHTFMVVLPSQGPRAPPVAPLMFLLGIKYEGQIWLRGKQAGCSIIVIFYCLKNSKLYWSGCVINKIYLEQTVCMVGYFPKFNNISMIWLFHQDFLRFSIPTLVSLPCINSSAPIIFCYEWASPRRNWTKGPRLFCVPWSSFYFYRSGFTYASKLPATVIKWVPNKVCFIIRLG